jgi:hypothetical protein
MILALGPLVLEAGLFEEVSGAVVQERGRDLLSRGISREPLRDAATSVGDEVQRTS